MTFTTDNEKIQLVKKLVEEKYITFEEGVKLLQVEVVKEYIYTPYYYNQPYTWGTPVGAVDTFSAGTTYAINNPLAQ